PDHRFHRQQPGANRYDVDRDAWLIKFALPNRRSFGMIPPGKDAASQGGSVRRISLFLLPLVLFANPVFANPHQMQIPLHEGKLRTEDLTIALLHKLHLPAVAWSNATIDL